MAGCMRSKGIDQDHFWDFICDHFRCDQVFTTREALDAYYWAGHIHGGRSNCMPKVNRVLRALEKVTPDLVCLGAENGKQHPIRWVLPLVVDDAGFVTSA